MWNLVSHIQGETKGKDVREFGAEKTLGHTSDEVTGEWRRLHNEELYALYSSANIIRVIISRRMRWTGHAVCMRETRGAYKVLVGRPEEKRSLERSRSRWKNNITMDIQEMDGGMNWIDLA